MSRIKEKLGNWLSQTLSLEPGDIENCLGPSRNPQEGDVTLASFALSKKLKKNPKDITSSWEETLQTHQSQIPYVKSFKAIGPYLNFQLDGSLLAQELIENISETCENWGTNSAHSKEKVCLDFSHPNIAKPFAIHHLRSTLIGAAIGNLLESQGYQVERINHLGDWGTQFGYVMYAWKKYHAKEDLGDKPIHTLVELYQKANNAAENDDSIHSEAASWFRRLEEGDSEARRLWSWFRDITIKELEKIYARMGIRFDTFRGEAFYEDKLDDAIEHVRAHGLTKESDGALIVDFGEEMPPMLLRKSDGASLYATRDVATLIDRWDRGAYAFNLYVVNTPQSLHFKQLFKVFELMDHPSKGRNLHIAFGMMRMPDGTLGKTRKGNVIYLDEVLDLAHEKAFERIQEAEGDINKDELAEKIGLGAVYFNDLKAQRIKDIVFKWEDVLSFEGRTGAYLQYAQARMNRILEKGHWESGKEFKGALLTHEREKDLMMLLDRYPQVVAEAAKKFEPNTVLNYLFDLVQVYSRLTQDKEEGVRILVEDEELKQSRLALVAATRQTLVNGLKLLCIPCPERM